MFRYPLPIWATYIVDIADEDFTFQIGTCTKNDSLSAIKFAKLSNDARYLAILNLELRNHDLLNIEIIRIFQGMFHQMLVFNFIRLATQGMHGRAFTHVEHTHLNGRSIRIDTHLTAQRIELIHKMTFTRAANGRVARHKCNIIQTDGRHQRAMTHAGAGEGRLTTSMTATDDNDIIIIYSIHIY